MDFAFIFLFMNTHIHVCGVVMFEFIIIYILPSSKTAFLLNAMPHQYDLVIRKPLENQIFAYAKTKTQISFAVTAKLISAFVFATWIVQSLFYFYPKFQASSHLLRLYRPVCLKPGWKPRRPFFFASWLICP